MPGFGPSQYDPRLGQRLWETCPRLGIPVFGGYTNQAYGIHSTPEGVGFLPASAVTVSGPYRNGSVDDGSLTLYAGETLTATASITNAGGATGSDTGGGNDGDGPSAVGPGFGPAVTLSALLALVVVCVLRGRRR